jgi:hypothetical protein
MLVMRQDLVGPGQIAEMLDLSRQRVDQLTREDPTFPEPEAELPAGRVWTRAAIMKWAKAKGRPVKPQGVARSAHSAIP